ncbi:MAG: hypothetical protein ACKV2O_20665 [Acidimicrobiales bacterium]
MLPVRAASVEQHLLACATCRNAVSTATPVGFVRDSWTRVADVIDRPPGRVVAGVVDRLLPDRYARPVSATLGLQWAWLASTIALAGVAALVNRVAETDRLFLSIAPLVAVAIVVATFAPAAEPGGEASYATPVFGLGLILRRLVAALVPALIVLVVLAMLVADLDVDSLVWLLPAVGLVSITLALSTFVAVPVAAGGASTVWVAAVILTGRATRLAAFDRWSGVDVFDQRSQVVAALSTAVAILVISLRREHIATLEVTW